MNNLKKVSFFLLLLGLKNMQAREIDSNVILWTKDNAAEIAERIAKNSVFFNKRNKILTESFLLQVFDSEEYNAYDRVTQDSEVKKAYILGAIQAELDQSKLGFSGQSVPMDEDNVLQKEVEQRLRPWIQKYSNKLIKYFNAQAITPTSFDEIIEASELLKIVLPSALNSMAKRYLLEEIVAGLQLNDMSTFNLDKMLTKTFDRKQIDYLMEYLIPKMISSSIKSVNISSLIEFLENLPNKGFVGKSFLQNLSKAHIKAQMTVVDDINKHLANASDTARMKVRQEKTLLKIVEVVKQLQDLKVNFDRLQKIDQQQQLARIVEVVKMLNEKIFPSLEKINEMVEEMSLEQLHEAGERLRGILDKDGNMSAKENNYLAAFNNAVRVRIEQLKSRNVSFADMETLKATKVNSRLDTDLTI